MVAFLTLARVQHRASRMSSAPRKNGMVLRSSQLAIWALPGSAETVLVGFLFSINREVLGPYSRCRASSYSAGGTPPSEVWRRSVLNQATYSTIASSSWERVRQTRSRISSVLNESTKLSASALSYASPTLPIDAQHAVVVEGLAVVVRAILRPGVAVVDQLDVRAVTAPGERHPQRVEDEVGAHVVGELPADDPAAVDVDHEREEDDALPAAQVGEIHAPELVGPGGHELALDEIGRPPSCLVRDGCAPRLAPAFGALNAVCAHQPLDLAAPNLLAGSQERLPHPPRAVGEVVARMDLLDQLEQPLVLDPTGRRSPVARW